MNVKEYDIVKKKYHMNTINGRYYWLNWS